MMSKDIRKEREWCRGGGGSQRPARRKEGPAKEKSCLCGNCLFSLAEYKTLNI